MKRVLLLILALTLLPMGSQALAYDVAVTPDVIYGSGNTNEGWTVDSENGIELGLRAIERWVGVTGSNNNGTYSYATGYSSGTAAIWNYDFHIYVSGDDTFLSTYTFLLSIDLDPTSATDWYTINLLTAFTDNEYGTIDTGNGEGVAGTSELADENTVVQNSQNLGWAGVGFDATVDGIYDFLLSAYDEDGTLLAQTSMQVIVGDPQVVPEPSTFALLALGGLFTLGIRRRMKKSA